jgi:hypothetical protein
VRPELAKGGGRKEDGLAHGAAGQWTREQFGQLKMGQLRSLVVNKLGRTGEEIGACHDAHEGRAKPERGSPMATSGGKPSRAASHRLSGQDQTTIPQRQRCKHGSLSRQVNGGRGGDVLTPQRWPWHRPRSARNHADTTEQRASRRDRQAGSAGQSVARRTHDAARVGSGATHAGPTSRAGQREASDAT